MTAIDGLSYGCGHVVWHLRLGEVMIPDQVVERMHLWDETGMPVPAITADGQVVEISLSETDA